MLKTKALYAVLLTTLLALFFLIGNPTHSGGLSVFPWLLAIIPFPLVLMIQLRSMVTRISPPSFGHLFRLGEATVLFAVFSLTFALLSMAFVTNDWRDRGSDSWTMQDINEVLNNSPWVRVGTTSFGARTASTRGAGGGGLRGVYQENPNVLIPFFPVIRLMTAKPIRDAYLRRVFIEPPTGLVLDAKRLDEDPAKKASEAMEQFAKTHPDDIGIKGDPQYIVVSVTFAPYSQVPPPMLPEVTLSDPLAGVQQSDLAPVTYLTTPTGKHITLDHYVPLGEDNLGAKFYFPRNALNGAPIIVKEDKELRFESRIQGKKIQVRFNLTNLVYQGKLEI